MFTVLLKEKAHWSLKWLKTDKSKLWRPISEINDGASTVTKEPRTVSKRIRGEVKVKVPQGLIE